MSIGVIALIVTLALPSDSSKLEGWHGLRIDRLGDCRTCCTLVLPRAFGATDPGELGLLRRLVDSAARREIAGATGCGSMALKQGIMEHLLRLAIEQNSRGAAEIILRADGPGGADLGGGMWSETHGELFVFPLLMGFADIASLVDERLAEHVAGKVCTAVFFPTSSEPRDLGALQRRLDERGAHRLASRIRTRCDEVGRELEQR